LEGGRENVGYCFEIGNDRTVRNDVLQRFVQRERFAVGTNDRATPGVDGLASGILVGSKFGVVIVSGDLELDQTPREHRERARQQANRND
jgi:hypothetical protein